MPSAPSDDGPLRAHRTAQRPNANGSPLAGRVDARTALQAVLPAAGGAGSTVAKKTSRRGGRVARVLEAAAGHGSRPSACARAALSPCPPKPSMGWPPTQPTRRRWPLYMPAKTGQKLIRSSVTSARRKMLLNWEFSTPMHAVWLSVSGLARSRLLCPGLPIAPSANWQAPVCRHWPCAAPTTVSRAHYLAKPPAPLWPPAPIRQVS